MTIDNYAFIHAKGQATLTRQLEDAGYRVWVIDLRSVKDPRTFIEVARRELPQDPPLVKGRNFDAFIDSFVGGMDSVSETSNARKFAVLLTHVDKLLEAHPELLVKICVVLSDVSNSLTRDFDVGEGLTLATFLLGEGPAFHNSNSPH